MNYNILLDKYNSLNENGIVLLEGSSLIQHIKNFFGAIIKAIKNIGQWFKNKFKAIRDKIRGNKDKKKAANLEKVDNAEKKVESSTNAAVSKVEDQQKQAENKINSGKDENSIKENEDKALNTIEDYKKEVSRLKDSLHDAESMKQFLNTELDEKRKEYDDLHKKYLDTQDKITDLEIRDKANNRKLEEHKKAQELLTGDSEHTEKQISEYTSQLRAISAQIDIVAKRVNKYNRPEDNEKLRQLRIRHGEITKIIDILNDHNANYMMHSGGYTSEIYDKYRKY